MLTLLRLISCWLLRGLLALRYRVRVRGLEKLRGLKGPTLVLPNHPAYVDPMIVFSRLWPALRVRPMVYEGAPVTDEEFSMIVEYLAKTFGPEKKDQ